MDDFQLTRNLAGRLVLTLADGTMHEGVIPVRAYPVQSPKEFVALMSTEGKEVLWIERLAEVPEDVCALINEEIASRDVMPVIQSLTKVSTYSTPSTWDVVTDRGPTKFILKGEEDIRRLSGGTLIITDSHGLRFYVADMQQLDKHSRRILDRFL
ncbi:MAG: DUF1854 domain-containing protein [Burkholderiaceae bacterium]|nr:DUF1854 domain-containing protein [Burkholderiaceae bacterium]